MAQPKSKFEAAETAFDSITKMEIPASVRDFAEKGAAQAKDTVTKFKVAADEASDALEGAYTSATKGVSTIGLKVLETRPPLITHAPVPSSVGNRPLEKSRAGRVRRSVSRVRRKIRVATSFIKAWGFREFMSFFPTWR